ncbi:hypothetical protein AB0B01_09555 [Streptomyces sp. NPDC044571]|uniref:hypothetical protein n=1 Tax=Streptomyces sp. NPDC044571 TaxID=3155371 RepID=UPI0033CCC032
MTAAFLAARHPRDSAEAAEVWAKARAVHEALERGEPGAADGGAALWLRIRAAIVARGRMAPRPGPSAGRGAGSRSAGGAGGADPRRGPSVTAGELGAGSRVVGRTGVMSVI